MQHTDNSKIGTIKYAKVYLIDMPFHCDLPYYYSVPETLTENISVGSFVSVPFGKGEKFSIAIVVELLDQIEPSIKKTKEIISLAFKDLILSSEFLRLAYFMKSTTFCTFGQAVKTIIPSALFKKVKHKYIVIGEINEDQEKKEKQVLDFLLKNGPETENNISKKLGFDCSTILTKLLKNSIVGFHQESKSCNVCNTLNYVSKIVTKELLQDYISKLDKRSKKLFELCHLILSSEDMLELSYYKEKCGNIKSQISKLEEDGIIQIITENTYRDSFKDKNLSQKKINGLSEEQNNAYQQILNKYSENKANAVLLYGVTGSGKTRVIKAMMDAVIGDGKSVILLIPEISLTPQTVNYFKSCYGDRIAVMHSSLSQNEKIDMWNRIKEGLVDICVGTRSAIFAPFSNIGMIVIDEEQEHTYKSDADPKYHARDIARFRCANHNALMLLSSATPSIESMHKAEKGKYTLVSMKERYGNAVLPSVKIVDMREEIESGNSDIIGRVLTEEIRENIKNKEQTILFLNRRGYHNFVQCKKCGSTVVCPHCSVAMTYHFSKSSNSDGYLSCHYCGTRMIPPTECSCCGNNHLTYMGYGTQKLQDELNEKFPNARIIRMDADTTNGKDSYFSIIESFDRGEADILIGTQMVTKGHDFPNVTLSAVLSADSLMFVDDYHASERGFDLICQLVGRAGRGNKKGRAIVQTYNPDHPVIKLASSQDYFGFFKNESSMRKSLVFPPFCDIVLFTLISEKEDLLKEAVEKIPKLIKELAENEEYKGVPIDAFGPFEAPIYRLKEKYRVRVVIKCRLNDKVRNLIRDMSNLWKNNLSKSITISIDVNPSSL